MIPNAVRPHKTDSNVIPKELGIYISKTEVSKRYQEINTDVIKNFCVFCLSMLNSVVECRKSKSCKTKAIDSRTNNTRSVITFNGKCN
jgi:hypothetical protein